MPAIPDEYYRTREHNHVPWTVLISSQFIEPFYLVTHLNIGHREPFDHRPVTGLMLSRLQQTHSKNLSCHVLGSSEGPGVIVDSDARTSAQSIRAEVEYVAFAEKIRVPSLLRALENGQRIIIVAHVPLLRAAGDR